MMYELQLLLLSHFQIKENVCDLLEPIAIYAQVKLSPPRKIHKCIDSYRNYWVSPSKKSPKSGKWETVGKSCTNNWKAIGSESSSFIKANSC